MAPRRRGHGARSYSTLVDEAAAQMASQLPPPPRGAATVVVLPVVGFGGQSRVVVDRALSSLVSSAPAPSQRQVVVVVNRPLHRADDGTLAAVRAWLADLERIDGMPDVAWCALLLERRPRIGELRQAGLDALQAVWGPLPPGCVIVPADDDVVHLPPTTLGGIERCLAPESEAGCAVGPVLFDDPVARTCLFPELFLGDLSRALIADWLIGSLAGETPGPKPSLEVFDSLALSCHFGVRADLLRFLGGFHDLNELTEVLRSGVALAPVVRPVPLAGCPGDPVAILLRDAARVSSRRALAGWASGRNPTVAQWRAHRLRSAEVDPVRVQPTPAVPLPMYARGAPSLDAELAGRVLATVFDYLKPSLEAAHWALHWLGLGRNDMTLRPPDAGAGWQVKLRRTTGLVDRLSAFQPSELMLFRSDVPKSFLISGGR